MGNDGWKVYDKDGKTGPVFEGHDPYTLAAYTRRISSKMRAQTIIRPLRRGNRPAFNHSLPPGNISTHLGRSVVFDPKTETFGDDKAANAYLKKQYSEPHLIDLPKV